MAISIDVRNLNDALRIAQCIRGLYPFAAAGDLAAAVSSFVGGPFPFQSFSRNPPVPTWFWMDTGDQVLVCAGGILTVSDGLQVFLSTLTPLVTIDGFQTSDSLLAAARGILQNIIPVAHGLPRRWVVAGHSYGGSVASILAPLLIASGFVQDLQLLTLGSPRPGDTGLSKVLSPFPLRRYMGSDDPIPRFPPHVQEAPITVFLVGFPVASVWASYVQPQGGVVLWPTGDVTTAQLPPQFLPIADLRLADWALSDHGFFAVSHNIKSYIDRLSAAVSASTSLQPAQTAGSSVETVVTLTQPLFQAAAAGVLFTFPQTGGVVMAQGFIPAAYRASVVKLMPGSYAVKWMGNIVLNGSNRANARNLSRGINAWLRRMQGAAVANHTAFNASLAAYWTVCISSSLGFNPPLNVT